MAEGAASEASFRPHDSFSFRTYGAATRAVHWRATRLTGRGVKWVTAARLGWGEHTADHATLTPTSVAERTRATALTRQASCICARNAGRTRGREAWVKW